MSSNIELMFAQRCQVFEKLNQVLLDNFTLATEDVRDKLLWENINLIQEHLVRKHNIKRYSKYTLQMTNLLYSLSKQGLKLWLFKLLGVKNFFRLQYVKYCLTKKNYRLMLMNEEIRYRNNNKNDCNKGMNIPLKVMNKLRGLFYILYFSLINFLVNRRGIWILMYHRINDTLTPSDLVISTKEFRKQMWYLRKYCNVISLQDVYDIYVGKKEMKRSRRPQVVITIDDGYRDNYQNAYPILSKFGLPATIFLVTGFIGTDKKLPRYQNMPSPDMLNWDEVRTMNNGYIKFCPHTESHSHLPELGYLEQIKEVKNSMDALVKNLSAERESFIFSYTYGEYNKVTLDVLRELGMKLSVTANRGINTLKDAPLELQRIGVDGREDLVNFMRKFITDVRST
jgi:peptidoglycan/xylan/chitin deacetylase (PgdA/CDA1 family)